MLRNFLKICLLALPLVASAQTVDQTAGIYYAYPQPEGKYTPAPDGYEPCYISHYGRHGSRWITDDERYTRVAETLDSLAALDMLTPLGEDVRQRVHLATADAVGRSGQLTPLGEKQHAAIARRMLANFPQVLADSAKVQAVASTSQRCILSMHSFLQSLGQANPTLDISARAYPRDMNFIAYTTPEGKEFSAPTSPWWLDYYRWVDTLITPNRLLASLLKSPCPSHKGTHKSGKGTCSHKGEKGACTCSPGSEKATSPCTCSHKDKNAACTCGHGFVAVPGGFPSGSLPPATGRRLMMDLYWLASDMQNIDLDLSFTDIFTYDELRRIWLTINARMYVCNGNSPLSSGVMPACATNLLRDIVSHADDFLAGQNPVSANLRFGHDTHLLRLLALMQIDGCAQAETDIDRYHLAWRDYELSPMAANLQIIFYRDTANAEKPVLVKLLLNEKEATLPIDSPLAPYYPWEDVKTLWTSGLISPENP